MYEIKIISRFAAAHQLTEYQGQCENLHGHNWKIEVYVSGREVEKSGLLLDFKILKESVQKTLEELDHKFLNELEPFKTVSPSSENIARYVFETVSREINTESFRVTKVTAWESESACASYIEDI